MTLLALALPALAGTLVVDAGGGGDATTIQGAIALAASGDTIEVQPGTYVEDIDLQAKTLAIWGSAPSVTILQGTGAGPVVRIDSGEGAGTTIGGVTITGGSTLTGDGRGGGLLVDGTPVALDSVIFTGNSAVYGAGAMLQDADGSSVHACEFLLNTGRYGAGLYVFESDATISTSLFQDNAADESGTGYGGGLVVSTGEVDATDVAFTANTAREGGGHVYATHGTFDCTRCTLDQGSVDSGGGAVLLYDGATATLYGSDLSDNQAGENGGAILARVDTTLTLASTTLARNSAEYGGAILLSDASLVATHSVLDRNTALGGGAVYFDASAGTVTNTVFSHNTASASNGGAIALDTSTLDATASIFAGNTGYSGGAIHVHDGSVASLTNLTLTENASSNSAGGIRVTETGTLTLTNTIIGWSTDGSGLSVAAGGTTTVRYGNLYENEGGATSGGITDPTGTDGNLALNPDFVSFADDGVYADDLHLVTTSPLIDAGDPSILDADGTTSDMGAYGGPSGAAWADADADGDGYSTTTGDCDDADVNTNPGVETDGCGGDDQDCDGTVDEDCLVDTGGGDADTDTDSDTDADSDTDTDTDADTDSDTDTEVGEDTGEPSKDGGDGCGCASGGSAAPMLGLLALGMVVRRRR